MIESVGKVESEVVSWLEKIVIGLNFCPFARKPYEDDRIRLATELSSDYDVILERILAELRCLDSDSRNKVETTLVVTPNALQSFHEYLACLADANELLEKEGYEGVYQLASFHPKYQFAGVEESDPTNLTNCSPFPVFHIIREDTLERVLQSIDDPEVIPERNIETMTQMEESTIQKLFPWVLKR